MRELDAESAELLPGREALGRLKFSFVKTTNVTRHVAYVQAQNNSLAANVCSPEAIAASEANQTINVSQ
ncbi:hypothetical protein EOT10_18470 [Streptomyces antnestii]|uniref:Uncharacterized protein n=2 Tax=Streptomyces TaxID=1883 RepID=A0A437PL94_9ACTN|nr:hypothetical protein EOT10_18470 [Streptomyces sp. San01]